MKHSTEAADAGELALEIALVHKAETATLTIRLDVPGSPTLVSTASISVHALDSSGIHQALEHLGHQAADRLAAKLDLIRDPRLARLANASRKEIQESDPARKKTFKDAQDAKRLGQYGKARAAFEAVAASSRNPTDALRKLAEDELRYGLLIFEARQSLNRLGALSLPGQTNEREEAMTRAENLFRQIQAENPSSVERVTEAQYAIDNLVVTRGAITNAMRANAFAQAQPLRFAIMEFSMMEGRCPDQEQLTELVSRMNMQIALERTSSKGKNGQRYEFSVPDGQNTIELHCDESGVEFAHSSE